MVSRLQQFTNGMLTDITQSILTKSNMGTRTALPATVDPSPSTGAGYHRALTHRHQTAPSLPTPVAEPPATAPETPPPATTANAIHQHLINHAHPFEFNYTPHQNQTQSTYSKKKFQKLTKGFEEELTRCLPRLQISEVPSSGLTMSTSARTHRSSLKSRSRRSDLWRGGCLHNLGGCAFGRKTTQQGF